LIVTLTALAVAFGAAAPARADHLPGDGISDGTFTPYDRGRAVEWALASAQNIQPSWAACTWFVSQTLWAGGLPADADWNPDGERGFFRLPGTVSATAAQPLLDYLKRRYPLSQQIGMDFSGNRVPEASPGDIVAYDWEGDGEVDHLAFVVNIADGRYPEVAEWGTGNPAGYVKRGWTWSQNDGAWLQDSALYPHVTATLFHIDTRNVLTY
jgi:hypothetical protein